MTKSRNINRPKRKWQPIEDVLLMACYPYSTATALAKALGATKSAVYQRSRKLGLSKSEWFKQSTLSSRLRREDAPSVAYRFPKGHVPANKGKKGISYPGMEATQFKPGHKPGNYRPVGSTRICSKDGYVLIKIEEGMFKWKALHRIVWERMNGAVPPGHVVY
ncbi:MAG TPA: hypothetical protein VFS17_05645, partial [Methylophilaceae bacterium]|nr:hypothetical protein [Methylophilaceae bacterium]